MTITCTTDLAKLGQDQFQIQAYDGNTYQTALLKLGEILMRGESFTPWFSIRRIRGQCNKHWQVLPRLDYSMTALTDWILAYFRRCGEVRGTGLKVMYKTDRTENGKNHRISLACLLYTSPSPRDRQ